MAQTSKKLRNLHGKAPKKSAEALLLIDVINDLRFPGGDRLAKQAPTLARRIARLVGRARKAGTPVLYVNDNFGRWRSDFVKTYAHCCGEKSKGRFLARALKPAPTDYFILKPEKSGFYQTPLSLLLSHLGVRTLILAGLTTDTCIFATACDANMRDYRLKIPKDCVISIDRSDHRFFIDHMKKCLKADTSSSTRSKP